jgi:hypothetical protein
MNASIRTVPIASRKCERADVLASEVRLLRAPFVGLYTDDGTEGGCAELYMSDEPLEWVDGTCWCEKVRKGRMDDGAELGPVELRFLP